MKTDFTRFLILKNSTLSYLEADLIGRLPGVPPHGVGGRHGRSVDRAVLGRGDEQPPAAVVQLEPVEDGAARDGGVGQVAEPGQVAREELADGVLEGMVEERKWGLMEVA